MSVLKLSYILRILLKGVSREAGTSFDSVTIFQEVPAVCRKASKSEELPDYDRAGSSM